MTTVAPRIAIVVVTYNSAAVLGDCLRSLPDGTRGVNLTDVVVADNASTDESLAIAEEATDLPIQVVQLGRNAGYAAAVNAGIKELGGRDLDAVLVLNPDCRLRPGAVAVLAEALRHPGRGIAVPRLVNVDGTLQLSLRRRPSVGRALAEAVMGGGRAGRFGRLGELITDGRHYEKPGPAVWATGAAMLISSLALHDTGPWDESFFLYSEETEFALRAADLGWTLWYEPTAVVEHIGGESGSDPSLAALVTVNRVRLFRRRHGTFAGLAYYAVVVLGQVLRAVAGRRTSRAALAALVRSCMVTARSEDMPTGHSLAVPARVRVGAVEVMAISEAELAEHVSRAWQLKRGGSIVTANVDIVRAATRDPTLAALVGQAELVVADGMPVVWAGRLAGLPIPGRVTGSSLVFSLTERAASEGRSVYLLGGQPGVPEAAARVLMNRYPALRVAGTYSPPFGFEATAGGMREVIDRVVAAAPELVLVALGFPKQERTIVALRAELPNAWYVGCGAGIPMAAGQFSRAPKPLQRVGGEWLYRLALEPRRLARRYLRDDAPFAVALLAGALRSRLAARRRP